MLISRRMVYLAVASCAALAGVLLGRARPASPPNVLVLVMDTTRADRCSINGYPRPTTPELEEFARDAVVYREAWSPAGWTGPAHASLFTGLRPENHGFTEGTRLFLTEDATTLAERFRAAGYRTGLFTNNAFLSATYGLAQGFDTDQQLHDRYDLGAPKADGTHRLAADWALAERGRPFFLVINDMEPHIPYDPPADISKRFLAAGSDPRLVREARALQDGTASGYCLGAVDLSAGQIGVMSDLYDAEIASLDRAIGALFDRLGEAGVLDRTVVVVTSDHGENLGDHALVDHKFSLHRTIRHVPLVIRYPGTFDGGRTIDDVVRLEDLAPTLLELAGLEVPAGLDGVSLRDLSAPRVALGYLGTMVRYEARLRLTYPGIDTARLQLTTRSVFDGRHHLIRYSNGQEELYDVVADPKETHDLASLQPLRAAALRGLIVPAEATATGETMASR